MKKPSYIIGRVIYNLLNSCELRYTFLRKSIGNTIEENRALSLRLMGAVIGKDSYVRKDSYITNPSYLKIGDRSKIGIKCELYLYTNFIVGNDVEIGSGLIVHTSEHCINNQNMFLTKQGAVYKQVIIEDDVYIGSRVTILSGVTINSRTIVGAGAVVTKDLDGGYLYGGIPAKPIRKL